MTKGGHNLTKLNPMLAKEVDWVRHGSRKASKWWRGKAIGHPFSVLLSRLMAARLVHCDILHVNTNWSAEEKAPETGDKRGQ